MKKLFICVMTSLCSTFAFADADLVVKPATITNGSGTMQVVINKAGQTAFQFDVKLPTGVSVSAFETATGDRKFEKNQVDASTNKWRFLSYDEKNATLAAGTTFNISLAADADAEGGNAETAEVLLVDPEGNGTTVEGSTANILLNAKITIPAGGKLAMVSNNDLDFTSLESDGVKAYIATGYEYASRKVWLTRVKQVPATTPIIVIGAPNTSPVVPVIEKSLTYYGENLLKGSATGATTLDWEKNKYFVISKGDGQIGNLASGTPSIAAEKVCIEVPQDVASSPKGSAVPVKIAGGGLLAYVSEYDLDFSSVEGLSAYIVTGFGQKVVWMTKVQNASANTPLLLKGTPNKQYDIPSSAVKSHYANMLRGSATENLPVKAVDGDYTTLVLSKGTGVFGALGSDQSAFPMATAYLPVKTSYNVKPAGVRGDVNVGTLESEVISISLAGIIGSENDGATSIRSIGEVQPDDAWYNLKGQRIDTPTKKGLYIKNGKKVVVK